jgi:hypothetical protein
MSLSGTVSAHVRKAPSEGGCVFINEAIEPTDFALGEMAIIGCLLSLQDVEPNVQASGS